jgi:hypothetical protein
VATSSFIAGNRIAPTVGELMRCDAGCDITLPRDGSRWGWTMRRGDARIAVTW